MRVIIQLPKGRSVGVGVAKDGLSVAFTVL